MAEMLAYPARDRHPIDDHAGIERAVKKFKEMAERRGVTLTEVMLVADHLARERANEIAIDDGDDRNRHVYHICRMLSNIVEGMEGIETAMGGYPG